MAPVNCACLYTKKFASREIIRLVENRLKPLDHFRITLQCPRTITWSRGQIFIHNFCCIILARSLDFRLLKRNSKVVYSFLNNSFVTPDYDGSELLRARSDYKLKVEVTNGIGVMRFWELLKYHWVHSVSLFELCFFRGFFGVSFFPYSLDNMK